MKKQIYLDYAASTPIDKRVLKAMMPFLKKEYGNPSSMHSFGQTTRAAIEMAREQASQFLQCQPLEIIFTGGASEANNLAIRGVIQNTKSKAHIVTSAIEHESVISVCEQLEKEGQAEVTYIHPDKEGIVRKKDVENAIKSNTVLVSLMYANSEIGTIQPVAEIAEIVKRYNILFHTDAVQAAHFLSCNVQELGIDLLTLSGHKIYGPKGVGLLYKREGVHVRPLIIGGGQEQDMRAGTENVAAIVGLGEALKELQNGRTSIANVTIRQMRDKLIKGLLRIPGSSLTGSAKIRLPNNVHIRFEGVGGKDVVIMLDQKGIAVSTGSACSEKSQEASHVLTALQLKKEEAFSGVRMTLGKHTKTGEIDQVVKATASVIDKLRKGNV